MTPSSEHHAVHVQAAHHLVVAVGDLRPPAAVPAHAGQGGHADAAQHRDAGLAQAGHEPPGDLGHAAVDPGHGRPGGAAAAQGGDAGGQRARLHRGAEQARGHALHVHDGGIGGVHAGDDGGHQASEDLLAEAVRDQLGHGDGRPRGQRLRPAVHGGVLVLAGPLQPRGAQGGRDVGGVQVARDAHQAEARRGVGAVRTVQPRAQRLGGHHVLVQTELVHEGLHRGAAHRVGLGAAVQFEGLRLGRAGVGRGGHVQEARGQRAAQHRGRLRQGHLPALLAEPAGGEQAGDPAADHEGRAGHA